MYGIGNNYYNYSQLYSSMFGRQNSFRSQFNSSRNIWNNMVPNYSQINDRRLSSYMFNNYTKLRDQMEAQATYERDSKEFNTEFDSTFSQLKTASSALKTYSSDSVFRPTGYGSSDSSVATVTSNTAAVTPPIHLEVTQTAASTSYASKALSSGGNDLQGQHMLTITGSDGNITSINVAFDSTKDNKTNLKRMARAHWSFLLTRLAQRMRLPHSSLARAL